MIPAFNEARRLPATLLRLVDELDETVDGPWEIIVADDGSVDGTAALVAAAAESEPRIRLVRAPTNQGKGAALTSGFQHARYGLVLFVDADLPVPMRTIRDLIGLARLHDLVVGTRRGEGTTIVTPQPLIRRAAGRVFLLAVSVLGLDTSSDPQCGVKLLRRDRLTDVVDAVRSNSFAFDIELIARARRADLSIVEAPVTWTHVDGSSIRPVHDALHTLRDLVVLRRLLRSHG